MTQFLHLTDARWDALMNGEKTDTIRLDEGWIEPGFLVYESYPSMSKRTVVLVEFVRPAVPLEMVLDLTNDHQRRPDRETLLARMRVHYPDITLDTKVDYIRHLTPDETARLHADSVLSVLQRYLKESPRD